MSDFIFPNAEAKDTVDAYVLGGEERPLIFHGTNGTGKSLLQRLIPNAIEQRVASLQVVKCADLKSADDIHDLYGRNKYFNRTFTIDGQRFNYIIIEEFFMTNKKMIDALKIELDQTLGTDLTILSTNRFEKIDYGIVSRSIDLELIPCEPNTFFPHAKKMFISEGIVYDDQKLLKTLEVTYTLRRDNRKYYQAIDSLFRTI
ncbi:ATP-binding protein [Limnohabitans sp. Rim28]|nr:ATP-binding protein [Limnohabitans sp. Rim28]